MDFNQPQTIRDFVTKMEGSASTFGHYMASKMGYRWTFQQMAKWFYFLAKWTMQPDL